jgi:AbrB family looped-hinge helix DNA binding protein
MPKITNRTTLTKKSQITLPKKVREVLKVKPGDQVSFKVEGDEVKVIPLPSLLDENFGKVEPRRKPEDFREVRRNFEEKVGEEVLKEY